jgi:hypothetical protein
MPVRRAEVSINCRGHGVVLSSNSLIVLRERGTGTHGVVGLNEGVVDSNDINLVVLDGIAEDDTTDTTEAVDSHLSLGHDELWLLRSGQVSGGRGGVRDEGEREERGREVNQGTEE